MIHSTQTSGARNGFGLTQTSRSRLRKGAERARNRWEISASPLSRTPSLRRTLALGRTLVLTALLLSGCRSSSRIATRDGDALLFEGMGNHQREISTSSPKAQQYFDQGLTWAYAFNYDEAIRSFEQAAKADPTCPMAYWGIALCNGPHINNPVLSPERASAAWDAVQAALAFKHHGNEVERDLIEAVAMRYSESPSAERRPLDEAYARAMEAVWRKFPRDADVGTLYAESLMDLRPWDLWTQDGKPQPGTEEIIAVLEAVMRLDPDNPGANHLYIHAVEASPNPERAMLAADRLRNMVPASGHLLHMPSHIDVLTGEWEQAVRQNELAIDADREYRKIVPRQEFYRVYMAHNHHMLSFACMMNGRSKQALATAREMVAGVPEDYARQNAALVDYMMSAPYDALKRFGRWDDILREPAPPDYLPLSTAMWRYSRGLAFAARGKVEDARREQAEFKAVVSRVPQDAMAAINPAHKIFAIAERMLAAEIAIAEKKSDEAVAALHEAVELEGALAYMEPPEWVQPVRHTLGAVLVSEGRYSEAERVYRDDLKKWPGNGWSLLGLSKSLRGQGRVAEADQVESQFKKAWAKADTKIATSCLCVRG